MKKVQNDLFQVGADLAGSAMKENHLPRITEDHVKELEKAIDELEMQLGLPHKFILPGGTKESAFLHLCRAVTRKAERTLVNAAKILPQNQYLLQYINRLSDFLYVLARQANKEVDLKEQQPMYKYFNESNKQQINL